MPGIHTTNARITATVTGGTGSVLLAGAQLANTSQDSSGFEMSWDSLRKRRRCAAGVTSLNGLTGALTLKPGNGISITPSGSPIDIALYGRRRIGTYIRHARCESRRRGNGRLTPLDRQRPGGAVRQRPARQPDSRSGVERHDHAIRGDPDDRELGRRLTLPFSGSTTTNMSSAFMITDGGSGDAIFAPSSRERHPA